MKVQDVLKRAIDESPECFIACERMRLNKQKGDWDNQYFIDSQHIVEIIFKHRYGNSFSNVQSPDQCTMLLNHLSILVPWRYTKGIYQFDKTLYDALVTTNIDVDIPFEVFDKLPQWSIYVELPEPIKVDIAADNFHGADINELTVEGFFVTVNEMMGRKQIIFMLNGSNSDMCIPYYYDFGNVKEAMEKSIVYTDSQHGALHNFIFRKVVPIMMQLTLYLCSQEPDIDLNGLSRLVKPSPVKLKHGLCLIPASKYTTYKVGANIGKYIRESVNTGTGSAKSPHIRRAHWHSYWTGKESEKKKVIKWLFPMIISGNRVDLISKV